jgi:hypothetical protein
MFYDIDLYILAKKNCKTVFIKISREGVTLFIYKTKSITHDHLHL